MRALRAASVSGSACVWVLVLVLVLVLEVDGGVRASCTSSLAWIVHLDAGTVLDIYFLIGGR